MATTMAEETSIHRGDAEDMEDTEKSNYHRRGAEDAEEGQKKQSRRANMQWNYRTTVRWP